ncbi:glycosyltransferase family 2 protein [Peribacillus sp. NPDC096379]|uniref:glycosyltransferase family 2 protein n=1 Tax=Peribacillus sp. NPDC096379 TaxID=3364393 RepID=UPI00380C7D6E
MSKVSIVIPVYNVEKYVRQCIDSVLAQSYKDFDLILVNDGSTDNSGVICNEYRKRDSRIKVFHKENGGLVSACTFGIMKSSSEFICFVDSDDWISVDFLEVLISNQEYTNADIVCCQAIREYENGNSNYNLTKLGSGLYRLEDIVDALIYDRVIGKVIANSRCGKLIRTSIVKNNLNFYREDIVNGEDQQLIVPVIMDCNSISILSDFYSYHYRYNSASITGSYVVNLWGKLSLLYNHLKDVLKQKSDYDFTTQLYNELITHALICINNEYKHDIKFKDQYKVFWDICSDKELIKAVQQSDIIISGIRKKTLLFFIKKRTPFFLTLFESVNKYRYNLKNSE